jgi:pyridoxine 5-phosphate synthase
MPALSLNLNKVALLRNSRGRGVPDLCAAADLALSSGAHGITVHPRRDQRHVLLADLVPLATHLRERWPGVELNVECEDHPDLLTRVASLRPAQCTLVPVTPGEVTSDHGWDLPSQAERLRRATTWLKGAGIRVSAFADCDPDRIAGFAETGVDRVELYTGPYAWAWGGADAEVQRDRVFASATAAVAAGLGVNAGHDLDRHNLTGLAGLPGLREVSIGHAAICRALEVGYPAAIGELLAACAGLSAACREE